MRQALTFREFLRSARELSFSEVVDRYCGRLPFGDTTSTFLLFEGGTCIEATQDGTWRTVLNGNVEEAEAASEIAREHLMFRCFEHSAAHEQIAAVFGTEDGTLQRLVELISERRGYEQGAHPLGWAMAIGESGTGTLAMSWQDVADAMERHGITRTSTAYREGAAAASALARAKPCPYPPGQMRTAWLEGLAGQIGVAGPHAPGGER
ncbi:MAG: hypothetical protein AAFR84_06485 [Pseudomonadota bacterium]